jgi:hypothetical protein
MVMLDYIQHTRPKCKHCTINVNGRLIKHKSYYDTSNREYDKEAERFKLLHYDTVNVTDLSFKGYEISGFGTINFISETFYARCFRQSRKDYLLPVIKK